MATLSLSPSTEVTILESPASPVPHSHARTYMSASEAYEFIRACISHRPRAAKREMARAFLETGIDWSLVRREAQRHRVLPQFFRALEDLLGSHLSTPIRKKIEEHRRGIRIQNTFLLEELGRIVRHFKTAGLPLLTMKGPVLAKTAYADLAARRSVDLDIVVRREQFFDVDRALRDLGYEYAASRKQLTGWRKTLSLYLDGQWQFTRAGGTFNLDVHTRVMPPGYSLPATFAPFWKRARTVSLGKGNSVRGFAPEDMILILSYHGIKNQWRALKYIVDLAELIRSTSSLNWSAVLERARQSDSIRVLKLGLSLSQEVMSAPLPEDIQRWIRKKPMDDSSSTIKKYLQKWGRAPILPYWKRVQLQLATKDTVMDQLRYGAYSTLQHLWSTFLKP